MARFDMEAWLQAPDRVGARFESKDLRGGLGLGLFSADRLEVPEGVVVLVRYEDGSRRLLTAGQDAVGDFDAVAVKSRSYGLDLRLKDLLSGEDLPFAFSASMEISVDCSDAGAVKDFAGFFLVGRAEAGLTSIRKALLPDIEEAVKNYTAAHEAEVLARGDRSAEIEALLKKALKRLLFEAGLVLEEVQRVRFESESYERILDDKIEATVEQERTRRREIIRTAWVKDQKDEILSNQEVQDLMQALKHEGVLKGIERRKEKLFAEKELQEFAQKAAEEKLAADARSVSGLVKMMEDAGFKDVFDSFRKIAREEVQRKAGVKASGFDPQLHGVPHSRTRRILCAAGKQVLAFRPDRTTPLEVHSLASGSLGMLRSVQVNRYAKNEFILAGAQFGVYLLEEDGSKREFRIPGSGDKRGGVNAAAIHGDALYATHSDYGLIRWNLLEEEEGEEEGKIIRADLTGAGKTCRGVQVGPLDRLVFAAGSEVFSLLPESLEGTPTIFTGSGETVTSLVLTDRSVFAGTAGGEVLRWEFDSPDVAPVREIAKRPDPIFMSKTCAINGVPYLLVGWKIYGILAKALEMDMEVSYPAEVRIRWVDGASDFLYGVDRDGRRLLVWEAGNPRARPMEIRATERIQDLCVWRGI